MRLVDCFSELFYYTLFLRSIEFGQFSYDDVRKHYISLFKRIAQSAKKAQFSRQDFEHALFATSAWIDETVISHSWDGRKKWMNNPLQLQLFHTTNAGEEFFSRLADLTDQHNAARQVFDYCLALGFRGKYFQSVDTPTLDQEIRNNINHMNGAVSLAFPSRLFPAAYVWDFEKPPKPKRLVGNLMLTLVVVIFPILIFVGLFMYYDNTLSNLAVEYLHSGY